VFNQSVTKLVLFINVNEKSQAETSTDTKAEEVPRYKITRDEDN